MTVEISREVHVTGRVQGVGYRAWTRDRATGLGLSGWVRNEPDGSVRAVLAGPVETVERMLDEMRRGPRFARVDRVEAAEAEMPAGPSFEVRR